ncbi:MAG: serine acetyltransferase [Lachnospiraceae bacterium]|nr:serine acetyltransferase [Lachnospiraceae bacterium]MCI8813741.1 serine acetyltransferase [Lachnospiraceae bacterium]
MISSKQELNYYIECDLRSLGLFPLTLRKKVGGMVTPSRWKLQIKLRKLEYLSAKAGNNLLTNIVLLFASKSFERYCQKLGCEIPAGVFGPGLCINHPGGIVVTGNARVGSNCRINAGVNIGEFGKFNNSPQGANAPIIGNNVYIGPGAKIFGAITIGDNAAIGANAVVNKNVPSGSTVVGIPGRNLENKGSFNLIIYGDERFKPE